MPDELATTNPSPEQTVISMQRIDRLQLAIESLPERRREILLLHKVDHIKYKDIAEKLGAALVRSKKNMQIAIAHCMKVKVD